MLEVILFLFTLIVLWVFIMLMPKNDNKLNGVEWFVVTGLIIICVWTFLAAFMNVVNIPIDLLSFSGVNITASIVCGIVIFNRKKIQSYRVSFIDVVVMGILIVFVICIGIGRFGINLDIFAYDSDDAARHLDNVVSIVNSKKLPTNRYVLYLLDAVILLCLKPFVDNFYLFKSLMIGDMLLLFFMGSMFWFLVRRYVNDTFSMILGMGVTILYLLGFPLNNFLQGFEYLGMGILMINFLLWHICSREYENFPDWMKITFLMLINTAICLSYTLFAPPIFIGEVIYLFIYLKSKRKIFSLNMFFMFISGIIIPFFLCVSFVVKALFNDLIQIIFMCVLFAIASIFLIVMILFIQAKVRKTTLKENIKTYGFFFRRHKKVRISISILMLISVIVLSYKILYQGLLMKFLVSGGMNGDGSIYRNPYGDFLIFLFPVIIYIYNCIKKKSNDIILWIFTSLFIFSCWLVRYVYHDIIGSYYFYKMHFVLWLVVYIMTFKIIVSLKGELLSLMKIYIGFVVIMLGIFISGIEHDFNEKNYYLWPDTLSNKLFGIYEYNTGMWENKGNLSDEHMEIFQQVYNLVSEGNSYIPIFGDEVEYIKDYYYVLSQQNRWYHLKWYPLVRDYGALIEVALKDAEANYIFVEDSYFEAECKYVQEFSELPIVFENDYGKILRVE